MYILRILVHTFNDMTSSDGWRSLDNFVIIRKINDAHSESFISCWYRANAWMPCVVYSVYSVQCIQCIHRYGPAGWHENVRSVSVWQQPPWCFVVCTRLTDPEHTSFLCLSFQYSDNTCRIRNFQCVLFSLISWFFFPLESRTSWHCGTSESLSPRKQTYRWGSL